MNAGTPVGQYHRQLMILTAAVCLVTAMAVLICAMSDDSNAETVVTLEQDGFTAFLYLYEGDDYYLNVSMYDGKESNPVIPEYFTYGSKQYGPNAVFLSMFQGESFRSPAKTMTVLTLPDTVENVYDDASIFKKLDTVNIGSQLGNISFLEDIKTLKEVNIAAGNPYYSSSDGVVFSASKDELTFYPFEKDDKSFTIPKPTTHISEGSHIHENRYLGNIFVEAGNTAFSSTGDGVLYDYGMTTIVLYPSASTTVVYEMPEGITHLTFPLIASCMNTIVFSSTFADEAIEIGFAAGYMTIPGGALSSKFGHSERFSMSFVKDTDPPSEVSKASDYDFYRISVDGLAAFDAPVKVRVYQIRYLATNMHVLHVDTDGNVTEVDGVERSRDGATFSITSTGFYTYKFNDTTVIKDAPLIAAIIAGVGTLIALVTVVKNSRRKA